MMVLRKPQKRMRCVAGQEFGDDANAVEVRGDCGGHYQRLFAARERGGAADGKYRGQHPSGKEVRDGTHGRSYFGADYCAKIRPKVTEAVGFEQKPQNLTTDNADHTDLHGSKKFDRTV